MNSPRVTRRELLAARGATTVGTAHAAPEVPVSTRELWSWVRAQQLLDPGITYLDTGTIGPGLRAALAIEYRQQEQFNSDIDNYQRTYLSPTALNATMRRLGTLLGCKHDELTITQGATEALGIVANGLQLAPGDEVIVTSHAHGSAIYPWLMRAQRHGVIVKQVVLPSPLQGRDQPLDLIAAAVTGKTRVIALSHLQCTDGAILPVADICAFARQRNILTVVDGAQACGSLDINIGALGCDFYATSLHKWLNGPYGLGVLHVRRELLPILSPTTVDSNIGWNVINRYGQASIDDEVQRAAWPATLAKFGCNVRFFGPKLKALDAALDFREQLGADRIEARIRELAIYARLRLQPLNDIEILTPAQPGMWSGILAFRSRRIASQELVQRLKRSNKILTSSIIKPATETAPEFSAVRVCLHIYNSHDDIERLVRALE
ncbi:MAG TPA: aminotransferase class V-fold PLP-dependent enzyme [Steroidobacteraceae bacterium]|nr:aminotransferase class V-fold PLP-dependent enzyme [Steroidobacteraceae bacterium]